MAASAGLLVVEAAAIDAINALDEAITVATLTPMRPVVAGEMIATVKIIPFAVPGRSLDASLAVAAAPPVIHRTVPAAEGRRRLDPACRG